MEFTARVIADFLNGEIVGNPDEKVNGISKIEEGQKGSLSFLANPKYSKYLYTTQASIVLINKDFNIEGEIATTLIKVDNAYKAFASLLELYNQNKPVKTGIDKLAFVDDTAVVGEDVYIGGFTYVGRNVEIGANSKIYPQAYIGDNVKIGDNTIIYSGVKIYEDCIIGSNCIIHSGTVIGSDGFGFAPQEGTEYKKIPQVGNVIIEEWVEIGSNVSIDRATMGSTIIRKGVKLDNLIQVAHNVEVGENTVIAAQSGVAGSTKIGKDCMIAAQVGIVGHLEIADKVKIAAQSGVSANITKEGRIVFGSPADDIHKTKRSIAVFKNLPDLRTKVIELERKIEKIQELLDKQ